MLHHVRGLSWTAWLATLGFALAAPATALAEHGGGFSGGFMATGPVGGGMGMGHMGGGMGMGHMGGGMGMGHMGGGMGMGHMGMGGMGMGGLGMGGGLPAGYGAGGFYGPFGGLGYPFGGLGYGLYGGGSGYGLYGGGLGSGLYAGGYRNRYRRSSPTYYSSGYSSVPTTTAAPYMTNQTYEPGDGYRYPLYYNPSTASYFYYPIAH